MHPFILFEGVDGTGKSTAAESVSKEAGFVYLHSPPDALVPFRKHFDGLDPDICLNFYLMGNNIMNSIVGKTLEREPVALDRHFPSTVAFHSEVFGMNLDPYINQMKPWPNRIYYLFGDPDVLIQRAGEITKSDSRSRGTGFMREYAEHYERIFSGRPEVVRIDTTRMDKDEVREYVVDDLKRAGLFRG